jgi:hypothetical protein
MRTLGVDLASQAKKTGICEIDWLDGEAIVSTVQAGVSDPEILKHTRALHRAKHDDPAGDAIGIDAPFGWPKPFVEFVGRSPTGSRTVSHWSPALARSLGYRLTDDRVHAELEIMPLTVSADRIAVSAMRCSGLLDDLGVIDRSGIGGVFEVYPAAALKAWGFPYRGYKSRKVNDPVARAKLHLIFNLVRRACPWLSFSEETEQRCLNNDDAFDALIASLAARAAALGLTIPPTTQEEVERARVEGWIAIPRNDVPIASLAY